MYAAELLAVGVEADGVMTAEHPAHRVLQPGLVDLELAEDAVEREDELGRPDLRAHAPEGRLEVLDQVDASRDPEDDAALDGAVELETAAGLDSLDGAHVVGPVDEDDDRRGGEVRRAQRRRVDSQKPGVLLRRGKSVDLAHETLVRDRRR